MPPRLRCKQKHISTHVLRSFWSVGWILSKRFKKNFESAPILLRKIIYTKTSWAFFPLLFLASEPTKNVRKNSVVKIFFSREFCSMK
jgi:hypothetical protein